MPVPSAQPLQWLRSLADGWRVGILLCSVVLGLPVAAVFLSLLTPQWDVWQHLADTVLPGYVVNSLILAVGVGAGALLIGTVLAWLIGQFEFPGRRWLEWLVLLPLAMPAYIIAYAYTGLLDFAGPVQGALRDWFGWSHGDYSFPEIRSLGGAIVMLSLVLYPYVYMLARAAFGEHSVSLFEASRTLGVKPGGYFRRVALPLSRPALLTGTALAMMEALADYGAVQHFGVSTFTTGIFRTWYGMGDRLAAMQLAAMLTGFVLLALWLEQHSRRRIRYYHAGQPRHAPRRRTLGAARGGLAAGVCMLPVLLGFALPVALFARWSGETAARVVVDLRFATLMWHSFALAAAAAVLAVCLALLFGYGKRLRQDAITHTAARLASLGYAIPGTVIAVGALLPLAWFDHLLDGAMMRWFNVSSGLLLSGTVFALLLAYCVRFLAVSLHTVDSGLSRIKPSMDHAARSLGLSPAQALRRVHVPLLRGSVLTAALLVFVDVLKELPATLILRPFDFNTLAVRTYELASDERLAEAAPSALAIVLVGLLPVIILTRQSRREE